MPTNQMSTYKFVCRGGVLFWVGKGETNAWEKNAENVHTLNVWNNVQFRI